MSRDFTEEEANFFRDTGRCPWCGSDRWQQGPQGGLSVNLFCAGCQTRINVHGPFTPELIRFGPGVYTEVINDRAYHQQVQREQVQRPWWKRLLRKHP